MLNRGNYRLQNVQIPCQKQRIMEEIRTLTGGFRYSHSEKTSKNLVFRSLNRTFVKKIRLKYETP